MKRQDITVDINRLSGEQLEQLRDMLYYCEKDMRKVHQVNMRWMYIMGEMSPDQEKSYYEMYCKED